VPEKLKGRADVQPADPAALASLNTFDVKADFTLWRAGPAASLSRPTCRHHRGCAALPPTSAANNFGSEGRSQGVRAAVPHAFKAPEKPTRQARRALEWGRRHQGHRRCRCAARSRPASSSRAGGRAPRAPKRTLPVRTPATSISASARPSKGRYFRGEGTETQFRTFVAVDASGKAGRAASDRIQSRGANRLELPVVRGSTAAGAGIRSPINRLDHGRTTSGAQGQ